MKKVIAFACIFFLSNAFGIERVGEVRAAQGDLKAVHIESGERTLAKHSDVYVGDTLITAEGAKAEVKFTDGTTILLIPESQYSVDDYLNAERYRASLVRGGVRVSTGLIAKKNPENFILGTPNATIGVRGTIFEARIYGGHVFVGTSSGKIHVANGEGSLDLGSTMSHRYAEVFSSDSAPEPLQARPEVLNLSVFESPIGATIANASKGQGTLASGSFAKSPFAWGIGLGGLAVLGAVVGATVAAATESQQTFVHLH